jgi:hypothetical protein
MVELKPFYADIDHSFSIVVEDVNDLKARGLITGFVAGGGNASASLTAAGRTWVEDLRSKRASAADRRWVCRTAILQWLDNEGAIRPTRDGNWDRFLDDPASNFFGSEFNEEDIESAGEWLWKQGFVDGLEIDALARPLQPHLTAKGQDCVERFGGNPRRYDEAPRSAGGASVQVVLGGNNQFSTGERSVQVMNVGMTLDDVREHVKLLVEFVSMASPDASASLEELQQEAEADLASPQPTGKWIHGLGDRLKAAAHATGNAAFGATVGLAVTGLYSEVARLIH